MKRKLFPALVVLSLLFTLLSACSSAISQKPSEPASGQMPADAGRNQSSPGSMATEGKRSFDSSSSSTAPQTAPAGTSAQITPVDRMIIYTANLNMVVKDLGQSMEAATEIVEIAGGTIAGTRLDTDPSTKGKDEVQTAYMSLRVPASKFGDVMVKLRKLAIKAPNEDSSSHDVTEEYTDLQSQLRNFEVVEAQYQELLKKAVTIDEILKVQQKLNETRAQIERIKGRVIYLERRADMATVNLYLRPDVPAKDGRPVPWDPIKVASEAWESSLVFLQAIASVAIVVMVFFWWIVPLIVLAIIFWRRWQGRQGPLASAGT